jgi:hypothetical protein
VNSNLNYFSSLKIKNGKLSLINRWRLKMSIKNIVLLLAMAGVMQGCVLTKIVSVPMRLGGAVVSIVPVVGNTAHDGIDKAAEVVDEVPI